MTAFHRLPPLLSDLPPAPRNPSSGAPRRAPGSVRRTGHCEVVGIRGGSGFRRQLESPMAEEMAAGSLSYFLLETCPASPDQARSPATGPRTGRRARSGRALSNFVDVRDALAPRRGPVPARVARVERTGSRIEWDESIRTVSSAAPRTRAGTGAWVTCLPARPAPARRRPAGT
jgi:hypothetical protein